MKELSELERTVINALKEQECVSVETLEKIIPFNQSAKICWLLYGMELDNLILAERKGNNLYYKINKEYLLI